MQSEDQFVDEVLGVHHDAVMGTLAPLPPAAFPFAEPGDSFDDHSSLASEDSFIFPAGGSVGSGSVGFTDTFEHLAISAEQSGALGAPPHLGVSHISPTWIQQPSQEPLDLTPPVLVKHESHGGFQNIGTLGAQPLAPLARPQTEPRRERPPLAHDIFPDTRALTAGSKRRQPDALGIKHTSEPGLRLHSGSLAQSPRTKSGRRFDPLGNLLKSPATATPTKRSTKKKRVTRASPVVTLDTMLGGDPNRDLTEDELVRLCCADLEIYTDALRQRRGSALSEDEDQMLRRVRRQVMNREYAKRARDAKKAQTQQDSVELARQRQRADQLAQENEQLRAHLRNLGSAIQRHPEALAALSGGSESESLRASVQLSNVKLEPLAPSRTG